MFGTVTLGMCVVLPGVGVSDLQSVTSVGPKRLVTQNFSRLLSVGNIPYFFFLKSAHLLEQGNYARVCAVTHKTGFSSSVHNEFNKC